MVPGSEVSYTENARQIESGGNQVSFREGHGKQTFQRFLEMKGKFDDHRAESG
jgi:hypothetical protein